MSIYHRYEGGLIAVQLPYYPIISTSILIIFGMFAHYCPVTIMATIERLYEVHLKKKTHIKDLRQAVTAEFPHG